jgi:hypothetical protein
VFSQLNPGRKAREAVRENSLGPWVPPCLPPWVSLAVIVALAVLAVFGAVVECTGNIWRTHDLDAV